MHNGTIVVSGVVVYFVIFVVDAMVTFIGALPLKRNTFSFTPSYNVVPVLGVAGRYFAIAWMV